MANNCAALHDSHSVSIYSVTWLTSTIQFLTNGGFPYLFIYMVPTYASFLLEALHVKVLRLSKLQLTHTLILTSAWHADYAVCKGLNINYFGI